MIESISLAGVAELADALDLGSSGTPVQVQVLSPAPKKSYHLGSCPKGQFCKNTVYLERGMPYSCFCLSAFGTLDFSHHFNKFLFTGDINKPYRGKVNIKTYLLSSVDLFAIMHFYTPNEPINNGGC